MYEDWTQWPGCSSTHHPHLMIKRIVIAKIFSRFLKWVPFIITCLHRFVGVRCTAVHYTHDPINQEYQSCAINMCAEAPEDWLMDISQAERKMIHFPDPGIFNHIQYRECTYVQAVDKSRHEWIIRKPGRTRGGKIRVFDYESVPVLSWHLWQRQVNTFVVRSRLSLSIKATWIHTTMT